MIEWIRLETEYEEFKETCQVAKEYFMTKEPLPILLYDSLYSKTFFRSSQASVNAVLKDYEKFRERVMERLGN